MLDVDDELSIRDVMQETLEFDGYHVIAASGIDSGQNVAKHGKAGGYDFPPKPGPA